MNFLHRPIDFDLSVVSHSADNFYTVENVHKYSDPHRNPLLNVWYKCLEPCEFVCVLSLWNEWLTHDIVVTSSEVIHNFKFVLLSRKFCFDLAVSLVNDCQKHVLSRRKKLKHEKLFRINVLASRKHYLIFQEHVI